MAAVIRAYGPTIDDSNSLRIVFFRHHLWRVTILRRPGRPHHPQRIHMRHASDATLAGPPHCAYPTRSLHSEREVHPRDQGIPGPRDPRSRRALRSAGWRLTESGGSTRLAAVRRVERDTVGEEDVDEGPGSTGPGRQKSRRGGTAGRLSACSADDALISHGLAHSVSIVEFLIDNLSTTRGVVNTCWPGQYARWLCAAYNAAMQIKVVQANENGRASGTRPFQLISWHSPQTGERTVTAN